MFPLPSHFFDLKDFAHADLFFNKKPVWDTLKNLKLYLEAYTLGQIDCEVPDGVVLVNPDKISIGEKTILEPGSFIEGPCIIGSHCHVRHGAYLRSYFIAGDHCMLGHAVEVKRAVLLDHASASHFNYIGDSLIGNRVNLGAGVVCANLRLDRKEVMIRLGDQVLKSGLKKLGAIVGDGSQLGCNSVINPGVLLKKRTLSKACVSWETSNWNASAGGNFVTCKVVKEKIHHGEH
ncbi:MAG: UDP-N-acetylglucosamine diphosphorylase [Chlamydiota bacterium]